MAGDHSARYCNSSAQDLSDLLDVIGVVTRHMHR
jgi:hypothetical protein